MASFPQRAPRLNAAQFGGQEGLFPADHPAMRQRTPAEFTPEEFREKPGAYHHATYASEMPSHSTTPGAAGIHLGTLEAAKDRIDDMGPRMVYDRDSGNPASQHSDVPADIHTRRLHPDVQVAPEGLNPKYAVIDHSRPYMSGSPNRPKEDRGDHWDSDSYGWQDRGAGNFGEFYRNAHEDAGSVSIRVPNAGYLQGHRAAIDHALRNGQPVHPLNRGLIENHSGAGIDEPSHYVAGSRTAAKEVRDPYRQEKVDHDTLLPYKVVGNPAHAVQHGADKMPSETVVTPHEIAAYHLRTSLGLNPPPQFKKQPAITYAATREEAVGMHGDSTTMPSEKPWKKGWTEPGKQTW